MFDQRTIQGIFILFGISVILALVVNTFSPRGIAIVGQWDTAEGVITAGQNSHAEGMLQEIDNAARAKEILDKGGVLFVDARSEDSFVEGHIPGAISLPVGQFSEKIESFLKRYPTDQPIVTYCSGRTCDDSHDLALFLTDAGFTYVRVFIDGFPGWQAEGFPVE